MNNVRPGQGQDCFGVRVVCTLARTLVAEERTNICVCTCNEHSYFIRIQNFIYQFRAYLSFYPGFYQSNRLESSTLWKCASTSRASVGVSHDLLLSWECQHKETAGDYVIIESIGYTDWHWRVCFSGLSDERIYFCIHCSMHISPQWNF